MGYGGSGTNVPLQLVADLTGLADKDTQDKILDILLADFSGGGGDGSSSDGDNVFTTIKNILSSLQTDLNTVKNAIGQENLTFDQAQNLKDALSNAGVTLGTDASMSDIMTAIDNSLVNKQALKNALSAKGVTVSDTDTLSDLVAKISTITTLQSGTQDATAVAGQMLSGATAYVKGSKVTGTIPSLTGNRIMPGTADKTIAAGNYLAGAQVIAGDAHLVASNIVSGKSIFGVAGTYQGASDNKSASFILPCTGDEANHILIIPYFEKILPFNPKYAILTVKAKYCENNVLAKEDGLLIQFTRSNNYNSGYQYDNMERKNIYSDTFNKININAYIPSVMIISHLKKVYVNAIDVVNYKVGFNYVYDYKYFLTVMGE